jgi:triosephosphate isomerase (TIM)
MTKNIIIANWKMNQSFDEAEKWLSEFDDIMTKSAILPDVVLCPPVILMDYIDELLLSDELDILQEKDKNIEELEEKELEILTAGIRVLNLGGQDCAIEQEGAFTGDISAKMLKDAGCNYVIIGHSERRQHHFENNEIVRKKALAALDQDLLPILCVGESLELRQNGNYLNFIKEQIENSIPKDTDVNDLVIAYEPVWSIGTGKVPSISDISEVADFIWQEISSNKDFAKIKNFRIAYGGSVNLDNSKEILEINNIAGLLIGGASLKADIFANIVNLSVGKK